MGYRVAIVGGGWYGCHIGLALKSLQMDVDVFEKSDRLMNLASGNNQFRLHLGFHYARHHGTRIQSRDGFIRFTERYANLSAPVADNLYAVPKISSVMDFETYKLIMVSSGLSFVDLPNGVDYLQNIEGVVRTNERVILLDRARTYFAERLKDCLHLGTPVDTIENGDYCAYVNGKKYDYVIDATWGHHIRPPIDIDYEPTILLYYETNQNMPAITLVDGPLCSVYPTEDPSIFTLSSVVHTPLGKYGSPAEAISRRDTVSAAEIRAKRSAMEKQISVNMPAFGDCFRFAGVQLAIKTKPIGRFDDRSCHVYRDGRIFVVMSGKIDTIFFATERILSSIEAERSDSGASIGGSIKNDILLRELADRA